MEARKLAGALSEVAYIISSDLKRALQTATIINEKFRVPLQSDPRLRECSFGEIEGLTREEALERFGEAILPHWEDRGHFYDFQPYGGEGRDAVASRMVSALEEYARTFRGENILIVSHGRALDTLLVELGHEPGIERGSFRAIEIEP